MSRTAPKVSLVYCEKHNRNPDTLIHGVSPDLKPIDGNWIELALRLPERIYTLDHGIREQIHQMLTSLGNFTTRPS